MLKNRTTVIFNIITGRMMRNDAIKTPCYHSQLFVM